MARLQVEIGGNTAGLGQAASQALGILGNLQNVADELKLDLVKATDVVKLNAIGGALTIVTGQIKTYTDAAIKGSAAFQSQQSVATLEALSNRITVLTGNANIFGESVKNQKQQIAAYEQAISKLLANGLSPLDSKIAGLRGNIDSINAAIATAANSAIPSLNSQFAQTGRIIPDLESKIKNLRTAISNSTDIRSIALYNNSLKTAQDELTRLKNIGISAGGALTNSANSAANAARKLSGGYNAVGLEFGRIIQDAPFVANNFGAIGNNITRLVEVVPQYVAQTRAIIVANGGIATSANVTKAAITGLFTGFGGVTIAISAVVSAFTFYQQYQQKVERETEKLSDKNIEYIDTLHGVQKAQLEGTKAAQSDLTNLKLLFKVYTDANAPLEARKRAYQQIQQGYPEYFKNIAFEEVAGKKVIALYGELTTTLLATARARAAANLITKNSERALENESKLTKIQIDLAKQKLKVSREQSLANTKIEAATKGGSARSLDALDLSKLQVETAELNRLDFEGQKIKEDTRKLNNQNFELDKKATDLLKTQKATLKDINAEQGKSGKGKTYRDPIAPKVGKTTDDASSAGLLGADADVEKARQKYENIYAAIENEAKKKGANLQRLAQQRLQAEANYGQEITQIIIAEQLRVASEVERINNQSGVKVAENRAKELAQIQKWYDEQVRKAQGNAEILLAIESGRLSQEDAVNEKYRAKREAGLAKARQERKEYEAGLSEKILAIQEKAFKLNEKNTVRGRKNIEEDLRLRLKAVQKYFDELRILYANDPIAQGALNGTQAGIEKDLKGNATQANRGSFDDRLKAGLDRFADDFFNTITNITRQADESLGQVFSRLGLTLFDSLTTSINDVFANEFKTAFSEAIEDASSNLSTGLKGALAGAGLLGGAISALTPATSKVGQGVGGALSGAAAGAGIGALGGPVGIAIGAGIGALVGLVSGISKANKAKTAEKQLEEQKKQTKLLELQNARAYTSSIIGRATTQGIVTGVEVNAFGQITTKIAGQDLLLVIDRASRSRKRGT